MPFVTVTRPPTFGPGNTATFYASRQVYIPDQGIAQAQQAAMRQSQNNQRIQDNLRQQDTTRQNNQRIQDNLRQQDTTRQNNQRIQDNLRQQDIFRQTNQRTQDNLRQQDIFRQTNQRIQDTLRQQDIFRQTNQRLFARGTQTAIGPTGRVQSPGVVTPARAQGGLRFGFALGTNAARSPVRSGFRAGSLGRAALPFDPQTGRLDPRVFPPPAVHNADDLRAIRQTSPDIVAANFVVDFLGKVLGEGTAHAPANLDVFARDKLRHPPVTYQEQALHIAALMIPVERILGWAWTGARTIFAREVAGTATEAEIALTKEFSETFREVAGAPDKAVALRLARGNYGERLAADSLAADGHRIISYKPDVAGTNQPGVDIVTIKDGTVYFVDNKALTRSGNVSSVPALTTNFEVNKAKVVGDLVQAVGNRTGEERVLLERAIAAIQQNNYKRVVTNANLAPDAKLLSGVTERLQREGIEFGNVFQGRAQ